jgi:hypothetical protein
MAVRAKPAARLLQAVDYWRRRRRWTPYTFNAWRYPASILRGNWRTPALVVGYRVAFDTCTVKVNVHGGTRAWRRGVVRHLEQRDYVAADDCATRQLAGASDQIAELSWLASIRGAELPPPGSIAHATRGRSSEGFWAQLRAGVDSGVSWNEFALGVEMRARVREWDLHVAWLEVLGARGAGLRSMDFQVCLSRPAPLSAAASARRTRVVSLLDEPYGVQRDTPDWWYAMRVLTRGKTVDDARRSAERWFDAARAV